MKDDQLAAPVATTASTIALRMQLLPFVPCAPLSVSPWTPSTHTTPPLALHATTIGSRGMVPKVHGQESASIGPGGMVHEHRRGDRQGGGGGTAGEA